jgi:hypothetical protein
MDELVELIKQIEESEIEEVEYLNNNETASRISSIAQGLFITEEGKCNWDNIEIAGKVNIHIFPVERDRFGWLIAGIETKKGIITFD